MLKFLLACLTIIILWDFVSAQEQMVKDPKSIHTNSSGLDTNSVKLKIKEASYYVNKPFSLKIDLDSAIAIFNQALKITNRFHSVKWNNQVLQRIGDCYIQMDDLEHGRPYYRYLIRYYRNENNQLQEAQTWEMFGDSFSRNPVVADEKISIYQHAKLIYNRTNSSLFAIQVLKKIADIHMLQAKYDLAEQELLLVIKDLKRIRFRNLHYTYDLLASVNKLRGNFHKELFYKVEVVKSMESSREFSHALYFYYNLAMIYFDLGFYEKSLIYYKKALPYSLIEKNYDRYYEALKDITSVQILNGRVIQALQFLKDKTAARPPVNFKQRQWMDAAFGNCYQQMGLNEKAETYYLSMIKFADLLDKGSMDGDYLMSYTIISNYYVLTRQYKKANVSLNKLLNAPAYLIRPSQMSAIQLMQFKVDSASGRLNLAIKHYQSYKRLNDSLFNATNNKLLEEVQFRNESENKDRNLELQSKSIQLLKNQSQLEQYQVDKTKAAKNIYLAGSLMLSMLLVLGYNRYRLKQQKNIDLQRSQIVISNKNSVLEKLLRNNAWLVKEAHHRVKNNMQIIISLLSSQSVYLQDEVAFNAVSDSRNRIQTMSLIHQKLYGSNNSTTIFMKDYIKELVDYLFDSFMVKKSVIFCLDIEPIYLDVIQAVPIGLILNEAITNSIKHAFPHSEDDCLKVTFKSVSNNEFLLVVRDNGRGLKEKFDAAEVNTFGLKLIKGLVDDLDGDLTIGTKDGTIISISFSKLNITEHSLD